jgi:hypothetical protein
VSVETARERIVTQLASAGRTGIALLTVRRRVEGDFIGYCGLIVGRAVSRAVARDKPVATSMVIPRQ